LRSRSAGVALRPVAELTDAVTALGWGPGPTLLAGAADGSVVRIPPAAPDAAPEPVVAQEPGGAAVVAILPGASRWLHRDGTLGPPPATALLPHDRSVVAAVHGAVVDLGEGRSAVGIGDRVVVIDPGGAVTAVPVSGSVRTLGVAGSAVVAGTTAGTSWMPTHAEAVHQSGPTVLCLSVRDGTVAAGDLGGSVRLVDVDATGLPVPGSERELGGYDDKVTHVAWAFGGQALVVGAQHQLTAWPWVGDDVADRPVVWRHDAGDLVAMGVGRLTVVTGHHDGAVLRWTRTGHRRPAVSSLGAPVTVVACHPTLPVVAVGDRSGVVALADL
jgi:hypothetical protein